MEKFFDQCSEAVLKGDRESAVKLALSSLEKKLDPLDVIEKGFSAGIRKAGELWEAGEYFLPELAFSAEAMKAAMEKLQPALLEKQRSSSSKGRIIIGTIQGDIHDIGKTLVATMLSAHGYEVLDLGADVAYDRFIKEARANDATLLCMSALLTTTMPGQGEVITRLKKEGLREKVRVIVGGAPTSEEWAKEIGADGYADNAVAAVQVADSLI
jgi:corrinoid protein of di/trimethylamine methyltransferase